jgi:hypothetical protein
MVDLALALRATLGLMTDETIASSYFRYLYFATWLHFQCRELLPRPLPRFRRAIGFRNTNLPERQIRPHLNANMLSIQPQPT